MDNIDNKENLCQTNNEGLQKRTEILDKSIDNRLATIEGHIKAVRKMIAEDKSCVDIIVQLMAIESSVKKTSIMVLRNHLNNCIRIAIQEDGNADVALQEYNKILEMYL